MAKNKRMDQIKDILSQYASCKSVKETARRLRVSRNTVRRYLRQVEQADLEPRLPRQAPSHPPPAGASPCPHTGPAQPQARERQGQLVLVV
jgi:DeoR/GlpR family transcriptional regulator of sugar metabolism